MSARNAILRRIDAALGPARSADTIRAEAAALLEDPQSVRPPAAQGDLTTRFMDAVGRLPPGASVERIAGMAALPAAVRARLDALGRPPRLKIQPVAELAELDFAGAGIARDEAVNDSVSLSLARTAIAETASLVLRSGPDMPILDAFLPLHHIVAVPASGIVPFLDDALATADLAASRNLVIVTGPSGTTDIEGSLVIGVHGPATLHIVVVD